MFKEIWKDVKGYEGLYKVSNCGNIKSMHKEPHKILKQTLTTTGYKKVELYSNGKRKSKKVHRLIAEAFTPNNENKPNVNHIDGNPLNNELDNLEWCTQRENVIHAIETGLTPKFSMDKEELELLYSKYGMKRIGELHGVSFTPIKRILEDYEIPKRDAGRQKEYNITKEFIQSEMKTKTQSQIARDVGCTRSLISQYVKIIKNGGTI